MKSVLDWIKSFKYGEVLDAFPITLSPSCNTSYINNIQRLAIKIMYPSDVFFVFVLNCCGWRDE